MPERRLVLGAEACAYGALYAGCNFYAGYPITPATEILETLAVELPRRGGVFLQMEDEIASLAAVIGAAWGGAKAMTATSGPGFSLMQEGIGYAAITETPCVIVDAQRWGPSTGQPTRAAQGDVLQAIWGTHGDHPVIVLTASSVREVYEMMVTAFNYAERYRVPVIFLMEEILAHLREAITLPEPGELEVIDRRHPREEDLDGFKPFQDEEERMVNLGEGLRFAVTGLAHDSQGFPVGGRRAEEMLRKIVFKIREKYADEIIRYRGLYLEDAEVLLISYGTVSRVAEAALEGLRAEGLRVGLLDLKTLWPFPKKVIRELARQVELIVVPELNLGQLSLLVEAAAGDVPVVGVNRVDGYLLPPEEIAAEVKEAKRGLSASARG